MAVTNPEKKLASLVRSLRKIKTPEQLVVVFVALELRLKPGQTVFDGGIPNSRLGDLKEFIRDESLSFLLDKSGAVPLAPVQDLFLVEFSEWLEKTV